MRRLDYEDLRSPRRQSPPPSVNRAVCVVAAMIVPVVSGTAPAAAAAVDEAKTAKRDPVVTSDNVPKSRTTASPATRPVKARPGGGGGPRKRAVSAPRYRRSVARRRALPGRE